MNRPRIARIWCDSSGLNSENLAVSAPSVESAAYLFGLSDELPAAFLVSCCRFVPGGRFIAGTHIFVNLGIVTIMVLHLSDNSVL